MVDDGWLLPKSDLFSIRRTEHTGRAVFASKELTCGTHLLTTTPTLSPLAHIILRPYRREVCAQCFAYDRGREWKIRNNAAGVVFCAEACQSEWCRSKSGDFLEAHAAVESLIKRRLQRTNNGTTSSDVSSFNEHSSHTMTSDELLYESREAWGKATCIGQQILEARTKVYPSKLDKRSIRLAMELNPDPDVLSYLLSGILAASNAKASEPRRLPDNPSAFEDSLDFLPSLVELAPDPSVYASTPISPSSLKDYLHSYRQLLSVLPIRLLPMVQSSLCHELASRASHNAFSIRPAGITDGEQSGEFLGWGVWPEASFFNHSCQPNLRKERTGRQWSFWIHDQPVKEGEELCITYLGGDEKDLDVNERRKRLQEQWGFWCQCKRCLSESAGV